MRLPRFRITWFMVFVAVAALNFSAIRAWSHLRIGHGIGANGRSFTWINNTYDDLLFGSLPMVNVLLLGLLLGQRRLASLPFLLGFEAFGVVALGLFVALAFFYTEEFVHPYVLWFLRLRPIQRFAANFSPVVRLPIVYSIVMLLVGLPQLAFALMGGLLFRKFGIAESAEGPQSVPGCLLRVPPGRGPGTTGCPHDGLSSCRYGNRFDSTAERR